MNSSQNKFYLLIICIMLPLMLLLLFNISFEYYYNDARDIDYLKKMILIINIATLLMTIVILTSLKIFTQTFKAEIREKHLKQTIYQFEEMMNKISKQRHDFNNHLQMVYGLIELDQYKKAKEYLSTIFSDISVYNEALKSENIELVALLHSKIGQAESKNIEIELYINGNIKHLPLNTMELSSIIGNLTDNALDATERNPSDKRKITLNIEQSGSYLLVSISNYTDQVKPEMMDLLFEKGFSTKNSSGLGLYIVRKIAEKYNGRLEVNFNTGIITFSLIIPCSLR
ncbi:MAG: Sensor protein CitS [Pelotomaculum sp. PtaU1.Bin035]|nr:MAG: Sensor protein CitS [Pelotomaculum sp. PtaU1.Bin035]